MRAAVPLHYYAARIIGHRAYDFHGLIMYIIRRLVEPSDSVRGGLIIAVSTRGFFLPIFSYFLYARGRDF